MSTPPGRAKRQLELSDLKRFVVGADVFSKQSDGTTVAAQYAKLGVSLKAANIDRINGWAEILKCLREKQQIRAAARLLGIGRQTLYNKVKALGIGPRDWRGVSPVAVASAAVSDVSPSAGLLKELGDLLARYSAANSPAADPVVLGEFHVPTNGFPPQTVRRTAPLSAAARVAPAARRGPRPPLALVPHFDAKRRGAVVGDEPTIDLFLRLGIDLRRKNVSKRRDGFWRRFERELDYLLVDARAGFLEKIKLAHPDRGGSSEAATSLSLAWTLIRRRFAKRGVRL